MPSGRGSIVGLRRHHRNKERATRDALLCAYGQLIRDKPHSVWTKAEFWRLAGLRSGNALRNPRHCEVLAQFEAHNRAARNAAARGATDAQCEQVGENGARVLPQKLAEMKGQLDKACSLNAVYQREAKS